MIAKLGGDNQAVMAWAFATALNLKIISEDGSEGCDDALIGRAPAEFGKLMPLFIDYLEQGDPVALKLLDIELGYIDTYANWFKKHGATVMAIVGGFGQRLFPILSERYGDFVAMPQFEPLHGAVILAKQNFS